MADRPSVNIVFSQKASSLVTRSGEMPVILRWKKASGGKEEYNMYSSLPDEGDVSATVYGPLKYCMANNPSKVIVTNKSWADTQKMLQNEGITNFIVTEIEDIGDKDSVVSSCRSLSKNKSCGSTAVYTDVCAPGSSLTTRDMHYIAIANSSYVKYYDANGKVLTQYEVNALYAGAVAVCGVDRSLTNYTLPGVASVEFAKAFTDEEIENITKTGLLHAEMTGGAVRVVAGINTVEVGGNVTEDMQYIEVVQSMDMIVKDITDTFCEYYRGKSKNNYNRQLLLIAAINGYFDDLASEEVLDDEYDNHCEIDVDEQRQAWIDKGNTSASGWNDDTVKLRSFGRKVFLKANVKVCQSMSDLEMYIELE